MALAFAPNGLQAVQNVSAASWSGQTQTFPIGLYAGGAYGSYNQNIYNGDVVFLSGGSLATAGTVNVGATALSATGYVRPIGVFIGCSYQSAPNSNTGFNTTSAGSPMYLYGTTSYEGFPVKGQIISDPNVIYTVMFTGGTDAAPLPLTSAQRIALINSAGGTAMVATQINAGLVKGNNMTGLASSFCSMASFKTQGAAPVAANFSLSQTLVKIIGPSVNPQLNENIFADDYLYMEVQLANHFYTGTFGLNPLVTLTHEEEATKEDIKIKGAK